MRILKILLILILSFSLLTIPVFSVSVPDVPIIDGVVSGNGGGSFTGNIFNSDGVDGITYFYITKPTSFSITYSEHDISRGYVAIFPIHGLSDPSSLFSNISGCHINYISGEALIIPDSTSGSFDISIDDISFNAITSSSLLTSIQCYLSYSPTSVYTFNSIGSSVPVGWQTNNIEVKAGYVLVVDRFYNGSIISDLPVHIQINSIVSVPKPVFKSWKNGASFGYLNALSDLSASDDLASDNLIWARPSNGGNFAGTQADFNTSSSRYWYFVNPLYYISGNKQYVNNSAIVKFENVTSSAPDGFLGNYYLVPLSAATSPDSPTGFKNTVDTSKETRIWYGTEDAYGNRIDQGWYSYSDLEALMSQSSVDIDSIGSLSEVPVGGNNSGDIYSSVSDTQSSAELTLFQKIENILSSGISSVDRLFQSAQGFFQFINNLWSWLPEDILLILSSVIIIFLVVASIKLFL